MKLLKLKFKLSQKTLVCFNAKELVVLILGEELRPIVNLAINSYPAFPKEQIHSLTKAVSDSRDKHELYAAIFGLYQEFGRDCEFCFYLKDAFDPKRDIIDSFDKLVEAKTDPPDIIIYHQGGLYNFELKRYRGLIDENSMLEFLKKKVLRYSEPLNFYILLQPPTNSVVSFDIFQNLHNKFKKLIEDKNIKSRVCFSLNSENQSMISVHIYPDYKVYKFPYIRGSDQVRSILKG